MHRKEITASKVSKITGCAYKHLNRIPPFAFHTCSLPNSGEIIQKRREKNERGKDEGKKNKDVAYKKFAF